MIGRLATRSLRSRLGRAIALGLSIVVGVAFVAGSFIVSDSAKKIFDDLFSQITQGIDLEVRGKGFDQGPISNREPVAADLIDQIVALPGVAEAKGNVVREAIVLKDDGKAFIPSGPQLGVTFSENSSIGADRLREGRAPSGPTEVVIDGRTARILDLEIGQAVKIAVGDAGTTEFTMVGIIGQGDQEGYAGASVVAWDPASAAAVLGVDGEYDTIDISLADGADSDSVLASVQSLIPSTNEAITGDQLVEETNDIIGTVTTALRTGLLVFAFITLFVSAFIINNVFSITIGQRLRELALLRGVGASGKQVRRLIVLEALIIAGVSTLIGLLAGVGVAKGIIALLNAAGGFPPGVIVFKPPTAIFGVIVGIGVTMLSVLLPARRASRIPPVAAMRPETGFAALTSTRRIVVGSVVSLVGLVLFLVGMFVQPGGGTGIALFAGVGGLMLYLGLASLTTSFARPVSRILGAPMAKFRGMPGKLAQQNAMRSPRRTASTASALMIGVSLVAAAAVFGESVKKTFSDALDNAIAADYFIAPVNQFGGTLPTGVAELVADQSEFSASSPMRQAQATIAGEDRTLWAVNASSFDTMFDLDIESGSSAGLTDGVMVHNDQAEKLGLVVGDSVSAAFLSGQTSNLPIVAIFDNNTVLDNWVISTNTLDSVSDSPAGDLIVVAKLADGASLDDGRVALERILDKYPQVRVQDQAEFRKSITQQIDATLIVISSLMGFAFLIALIGIAITLALAVYERTREIGLMRSIGMGRKQVRSMVRWEAVIVTVFGAVVGVVVGLILGVSLSAAVPDSFVKSVAIPIPLIIIILVLAVAAGMVAAWYPARKASRLNVLDAIATT